MSSRQLRKLQQQRELEEKAKLAAAADEEESGDELVVASKPKASLFASLAALEDGEEDDEQEEDHDDRGAMSEKEAAPSPTSKQSKRSKKKKKKAKAKAAADTEVAEEKPPKQDGPDEIDEALRALDIDKPRSGNTAEPAKAVFDPQYERICALLGINSQHLKVANEMRNLFGRAALENHDEAGGAVPRAGRRRQRTRLQEVDLETALRGRHLPGKGLPEFILRRNNFIQGKDEWPKGTTGGLTMAVIDDQREEDGTIEFTYSHNSSYQDIQRMFHALVEIGSPQQLIELLATNPYHISLLIQVSKIAKDQTDHALSVDLLERALFTFGRASSSFFNNLLAKGKARLDFARPENRELWLAGYQYIKSLVMKGTYRTALEWAKLLLSIDMEGDPYCVGRLLIHHLAIRANEYKWLLDLAETELPKEWNIVDKHSSNHVFNHVSPSLAYAAMKLREGKRARDLLSNSMQTVPWLFTSLFKEIGLDAPPSIWGVESRTDAETLFTAIYIQQCKDLWNTPEATSLLMEVAHTIAKPNVDAIPKTHNREMTLDVVRFVYLENIPSIMRLAPSDLLHRSNNSDADPLPPNSNVFSYETQRLVLQPRSAMNPNQEDLSPGQAALQRFFPGLFDEVPALEEEDYESSDEGSEEGVADEESRQPTVAQRLLNMLWPARQASNATDRTQEDEDDDDAVAEAQMPGRF